MRKIFTSMSAILILVMLSVTASAADPVSYRYSDENGQNWTTGTRNADEYTELTAENIAENLTWNEGWYVVTGDVAADERITVNGDVHLILADGCELKAGDGINVSDNDKDITNGSTNNLTIYAQSDAGDMGKLTSVSKTDYCSGIGGNNEMPSGAITIHGGDIYAGGGDRASAIGGGRTASNGCITIHGGTVYAQGGYIAAAIGGGNCYPGGIITINGGNVTARNYRGGWLCGACIGGGGNGGGSGFITINGGIINAINTDNYAAFIGGGPSPSDGGEVDEIHINGGTINMIGNSAGASVGAASSVINGIGGGLIYISDDAVLKRTNNSGTPVENTFGGGDGCILFRDARDADGNDVMVGTVYGDFLLKKDLVIPAGHSLIMSDGSTLTLDKGVELRIKIGASFNKEKDDEAIFDDREGAKLVIEEKEEHSIHFQINGGEEFAPVSFVYGTEVDLTAYIPERYGYNFTGWYTDPALTNRATSLTLKENVTLYAGWVMTSSYRYSSFFGDLVLLFNQTFAIDAAASEGGTITPEGSTEVAYDRNMTCTITPDEGYVVASVVVDGEEIGTVDTYTFKRVKENGHFINVTFARMEAEAEAE